MANNKAPTHYDLLGVSPTATADEIKRVWRSWSTEHHPDHGHDADEFARRSAAKTILLDAQARAQYDRSIAAPAPAPPTELEQAATHMGAQLGAELDRRDSRTGGLGKVIGAQLGSAAARLLQGMFEEGK